MRYLIFFLFFLGCEDVPMYSESDPVEEIRHVDTGEDKDTETDTVESIFSETDTEIPTETEEEVDPSETGQETATETDTGVEVISSETETVFETDTGDARLVVIEGLLGGYPGHDQCFYDSELEIECCPYRAGDSITRCLPEYHANGGNQSYFFADGCDGIPLAILDKPDLENQFFDPEIDPELFPKYILAPDHNDDGLYLYSVFETGDQFFEGMVYNGLSGCQAVILSESQRAPYYYFEYGPQVDSTIFAEIQE